MTIIEYEQQLSAYNFAVNQKRRLKTIIRMNKIWQGSGMGKRSKQRTLDIADAEDKLANLVIPVKPEPIIEGFEAYDNESTFAGFIKTQDKSEAQKQVDEFYGVANFTLKAKYR